MGLCKDSSKRHHGQRGGSPVHETGATSSGDATSAALPGLSGYDGEDATLRKILGQDEADLHQHLWHAARSGLIERVGASYTFRHDRIQEAAYDLIPEHERAAAHLTVGKALGTRKDEGDEEKSIFEIVNHLNRGVSELHSTSEKEWLADLNLNAAIRCKAATAYDSASSYLAAGCALLDGASWERFYDSCFKLHFHTADCLFLQGNVPAAEEAFISLSGRAATLDQLRLVVGRQVILYTYLGKIERAVELSLACLERFGVALPARPASQEVEDEYALLIEAMGSRSIEDLIDLRS